jgi:hypothetical protein
MTSVWLVTNGGSGEDGDEWHLFDIYATEEAANAHVAEENARRGFMEFEVEEWNVKGSPLTDAERAAIKMAVAACKVEEELNTACDGRQSFAGLWSDRAGVLRSLLERTRG